MLPDPCAKADADFAEATERLNTTAQAFRAACRSMDKRQIDSTKTAMDAAESNFVVKRLAFIRCIEAEQR